MTEGQKLPERDISLDILRVAATLAVVLLHTISGVADTMDMTPHPFEGMVFVVVQDIITWCVPVFIMISGYLFLHQGRDFTFLQMIRKYCMRIVLALILFGVPYAFLELVVLERTVRLGMFPEAFIMMVKGKTWSHMWYLYLILFLYLITPALRWCLKRIPKPLVYAMLLVLFIGSSVFTFLNKYYQIYSFPMLPDEGIYFFYYICGYLFACRDAEETTNKKAIGTIKYIVPIAIIVLLIGMIVSRTIYHLHVEMAYNYPFTVLLALLVFGFVKGRSWKLGEKAVSLLLGVSRLSFAIYLIHPVFLNVSYKFLHITPLDFQIGVSLPLFWLGTLVLSGVAAWILRKIPFLRKCVL